MKTIKSSRNCDSSCHFMGCSWDIVQSFSAKKKGNQTQHQKQVVCRRELIFSPSNFL